MNVIEKIQQEQLRSDIVPFKVGDTIKVYSRIKEADRERVQMFSGIVINKQTGRPARCSERPNAP